MIDDVVQAGVTHDARVFDRIRWRARRGLLENDLLLRRFLEEDLESLSAEELKALDQMLLLSDNDLLDLLMGRKTSADALTSELVLRIQKT